MTAPSIGVVTIAAGRRDHLARQVESLRHQTRPPDAYVVVDMGGPPIPQGGSQRLTVIQAERRADELELARCRNLGRGAVGTDRVVFLDVDCIATPGLIEEYDERLDDRPGIHAGPVGYLPARGDDDTWDVATLAAIATYHEGRPHPNSPLHRSERYDLFWSLSFAIDDGSWHRIGAFDERYVGYGGEDTDFARTARERGVDLWFGGTAGSFHQFHRTSSPPTEHLESICRNAALYHDKWGEWPMAGWLQAFAARGLIDWSPSAGAVTLTGAVRRTAGDAAPR